MPKTFKFQNFGKNAKDVRKSILKRMKYSLPTSGLYHDAPFDEGWRIDSVRINKTQSKKLGSKVFDIKLKKKSKRKKGKKR